MDEDDKDITGIWSCRMLPTLVERLLEKTSLLESLVVRLERSNQQLVSLVGEQSQEFRGVREDIANTPATRWRRRPERWETTGSDIACGEQPAT